MAKQVIFQKVREAERDTVFLEYNHRAGEVLNATVKRLEPMDVIFDLGKAEARMPKREQSRLEQFAVGERVRVVLLRVDRAAKGPQVIVSRAAPGLVQNLFQSEVPEIYDGTVSIKAIAREAGERTKIAVVSRDKDVDPVGACVGMKGMRVQSIIRELRGEKIDIIEYSDEITTFAEKALQPAKVSKVSITDLGEKQIEVIVDDRSFRLPSARRGRMCGWRRSCWAGRSTSRARKRSGKRWSSRWRRWWRRTTPIEQVTELGDSILEKLIAAGLTTVEALADMTPEQLEEIPGIGEKTLEKISVAVRHYFGQYEEGEERPEVVPEPTHGDETVMTGAPASEAGEVEEVPELSTESIADAEEVDSQSDALSEADAREESIEERNDAVDSLVNESQEVGDEGIDTDAQERG